MPPLCSAVSDYPYIESIENRYERTQVVPGRSKGTGAHTKYVRIPRPARVRDVERK